MASPYLIPILLVLGGFLVALVVYLSAGAPPLKAMHPNLGTRTFLVLLRLAIGWHCLVEGLDKLADPDWSGAGYLRQATGPLAPQFRELAGTPVFDKLTLEPAVLAKLSASLVGQAASPDGAATALYADAVNYPLPPALAKEWDRYYDQFVAYYGLDIEQQKLARLKYDQARAGTFLWLATYQDVVSPLEPARPIWLPPESAAAKSEAGPDEATTLNLPGLMGHYRDLLARLERIETEELPRHGEKVHKELNQTRAAAVKLYGQLEKELANQDEALKQSLFDVLTAEQQHKPPLPAPVPPLTEWSQQRLSDAVVKYGLVIAGACLIVGLATRPAALFLAVLLLLFYLAMPPLPGWPEVPRSEGHYLFINKNLIEMLALIVLATTPSGRWLGLDGLLTAFRPGRRRPPPAAAPAAPVTPTPTTP